MRRGFVLATVLFALVLLSAVAAVAFFAALQEMRIGRNAAGDAAARGAAAAALATAVAAWDPVTHGALRPGDHATLAGVPGAGVEAWRLSEPLVLLRATVPAGAGGRGLEAVVRLTGLDLQPVAALRARSADALVASLVSGADQAPPGWRCPPADSAASLLLWPGAADSAFLRLGTMDWTALGAWVASRPLGTDSVHAVLVGGDSTLDGGRFVGILLVQGDLVLRGGAEVNGVLLVRGTLRFDLGGGAVHGVAIASQAVVAQSVAPYQVTVQYSACAAGLAAYRWGAPNADFVTRIWGVY
jgi:hypothetical protein